MKLVDAAALRRLSEDAARHPRRRLNRNLHPSPEDPVQRLLNAFEPGTYVRPHRHLEPPKWELFVWVAGAAAVLVFDDRGRVTERVDLGDSAARLVELPPAAWHTVVSLATGTVLFEVKPGPYAPARPAEFAPWAPAEGDPLGLGLERWFRRAALGDSPPAPDSA